MNHQATRLVNQKAKNWKRKSKTHPVLITPQNIKDPETINKLPNMIFISKIEKERAKERSRQAAYFLEFKAEE